MGTLLITYSEPGRKPLSVARVNNPVFLRAAALEAISEAQQELDEIKDPVMARIQSIEVSRLRSMLEVLVPGLAEPALQLRAM